MQPPDSTQLVNTELLRKEGSSVQFPVAFLPVALRNVVSPLRWCPSEIGQNKKSTSRKTKSRQYPDNAISSCTERHRRWPTAALVFPFVTAQRRHRQVCRITLRVLHARRTYTQKRDRKDRRRWKIQKQQRHVGQSCCTPLLP